MNDKDHPRSGGCWQAVADTLAASGVRRVFGLPSDEPGLLDAATAVPGLDVTVVGDQRVAACAAAGWALAAREPVALALNSGPSFANALPGLLEAASLSVPLTVITTRVPEENIGRGAFQYVDQLRMIEPLAGWTHRVEHPGQLVWAVHQAVRRAVDGRPDLTVIEIAEELTTQEHQVDAAATPPVRRVRRLRSLPPPSELDRAAETLRTADRPLIVAGGGTRWSQELDLEEQDLEELADVLGAPVFTTAAGRGAVDEGHPRSFGLVGLYTTPPAADLLNGADTILVLGSKLEETARMGWDAWRTAHVIQVDASPQAFGEGCPVAQPLLGDTALVTAELITRLKAEGPRKKRAPATWSTLQRQVAKAQQAHVEADFATSPVRAALSGVRRILGPKTLLVQENGLHDIWSYHYPVVTVARGARPVCPGEQTMMGFGLGASVGAALTRPAAPVVLLTGDSALRLSVGALDALRHHSLGVIIVVFDNQGFGWPRRLRTHSDAPHVSTAWAPDAPPDRLAAAFGGWGTTAADQDSLTQALHIAQHRSRQGDFSIIRVPVPDDDVPIGIEAAGY
ncbi:thiamine pyrophosphate-binding protein [Streptomyces sp. NBC_01275]|uniref:thiamine pyrophosphate-binding protein n=1 Tax=Streptomyces sp. NBC_01275 TaxID=2903807 RepID=UPI00224E5458|nr:thiamine pyrophosphate-binding protein [Streptomyces sp. NBC_01275]MCX4764964.1 thiamine pyrophosphate-binding protein [Streptomyces sp. NBC_01275]